MIALGPGEEQEGRLRESFDRVIHDIQTRMQALIASSENVALQVDPLLRQEADEVVTSARALDTIVFTAAGFEREYKLELIQLEAIIDEAVRTYAVEAKRLKIRVGSLALSGQDIKSQELRGSAVMASRIHLQHAVNNLIHNAIKYSIQSYRERERVEVDGYPEGKYYCIRISNYGIGILPEEKSRIFDDGYQGALVRQRYRTGSGKGLYFVKRVIDEHHGKIDVESVPVRADRCRTRFTVWLPASGK